jgi:hypothetical protein
VRRCQLAVSKRATRCAETQDSPCRDAQLAVSKRTTRRAETQDSRGRLRRRRRQGG